MTTQAMVPVKSAWLSKINWTAAGSAATALIVSMGIDIPPNAKAEVLTIVTIASSVLTWVMRTWFTGTITPASAEK